jgi:glutamine amidotransferase
MSELRTAVPTIAIVDYGMGNLYSVRRACEEAGMVGRITSSAAEVLSADAVILPGVGAFPDAMATLHRLDLISVLRDIAQSGKPLIGICLGMQLLMSESEEFGASKGLDIIRGTVKWIRCVDQEGNRMKVPQVGWNTIRRPEWFEEDRWTQSALKGLVDGTFMYFVHSLVVQPEERAVCLAVTRYGSVEFCSALQHGNVFACQFHPERSGDVGLQLYSNIHALIS